MTLKNGDRGEEVRQMQLKLKAAGFDPGDIDGIFGKKSLAALIAFQSDYEELDVDGIYGEHTAEALDQALVVRNGESPDPTTGTDPPPAQCADDTWNAFMALKERVVSTPIRYGPGRGLFDKVNNKWVITYGPGGLGIKQWPSHLGKTYQSFHCSSWTNFFLGWLLRYNENYTHAGNMPSLFKLLEESADLHQNPGGGPYRGYGPHVTEFVSNGETVKRKGVAKVIDIEELHDLVRRCLRSWSAGSRPGRRTAGSGGTTRCCS